MPILAVKHCSIWYQLERSRHEPVSQTSHLALRRHVVGRHVDLDDLEIAGLPDHVVRDAAGLAQTRAGDDGDRFVCAVERNLIPPFKA